ncbi:MAG: phosphate/phosphite/phosphonate ABC transporter substrate-binding protein [Tagaea sp.]
MKRRTVLLAAPALAIAWSVPAAADWRREFRELRFGITSAENESDTLARWDAFSQHMQRKMGVRVSVHRGSDYAAVVEALHSRRIEFARMGPAAYARAVQVMGDNIVPLARDMDLDGSVGYHSVVVVRADAPFRTLEDLKGKSLAFADPNSASGFQAPSYFMTQEGKAPATFFGRTGFAGNHETGVLAVVNRQFDAAATWLNNPARSNVSRMEEKRMIEAGAVRVVWTSPMIPNSPWVMRRLPADLAKAYTDAILAMPQEAPEVWNRLVDGKMLKTVPAGREDYVDMVRMIEQNQRQRRGS